MKPTPPPARMAENTRVVRAEPDNSGRRERELSRLRLAAAGYLGALVLQFWLGIWVNLFVGIPTHHPGAHPSDYFSGVFHSVSWAIVNGPSLWLTAHAILGLILVLGALSMLVRGILLASRRLIISFAVGAFGVIGAGFNGGSFLNYNHDFSSMLMASGLAIAMLAYLSAILAPTASQSAP